MSERTECPWVFAPCADPDACERHRPVTVINLDIEQCRTEKNRLVSIGITAFVAALIIIACTGIVLQGKDNILATIAANGDV